MLEIKNLVTPSPEIWQIVIHGMRSAFKSWDKSDSVICTENELNPTCYENCPHVDHWEDEDPFSTPVCEFDFDCDDPVFVLGKNDKKLLLNLTKLGTSDRKVLRQLPIIMEITAPSFWWRQFDTYKVGTAANSTSQMHRLIHKEFIPSDFSMENLQKTLAGKMLVENIITQINDLRDAYLHFDEIGDKEQKDLLWLQILEAVPQSFNYTRTVSLNYEVALTIIIQRKNHPLNEWHTLIDYLLENVPYLKDIYDICYEKQYEDLKEEVRKLKGELEKLKNDE